MEVRSGRADTLIERLTPCLICQLKSRRSCWEDSRQADSREWAGLLRRTRKGSLGHQHWLAGRKALPRKDHYSLSGSEALVQGAFVSLVSRCGTGWPCPWDSFSVPMEVGPEISSLSLGQPGAMMPC